MKKTAVGMVLLMLVMVLAGAWLFQFTRDRATDPSGARALEAMTKIEQARAEQAQAEAQEAEAEAAPKVVRETYAGQALLEAAESQARQSEKMVGALVLIATEDVRSRDNWRIFVQFVILLGIAVTTFVVTALYGHALADEIIAKH